MRAAVHVTSMKRKSLLWPRSKGPGSSRVLDALSRHATYLSLILNHSDTKRDKKSIVDPNLGVHVRIAPPHGIRH